MRKNEKLEVYYNKLYLKISPFFLIKYYKLKTKIDYNLLLKNVNIISIIKVSLEEFIRL